MSTDVSIVRKQKIELCYKMKSLWNKTTTRNLQTKFCSTSRNLQINKENWRGKLSTSLV